MSLDANQDYVSYDVLEADLSPYTRRAVAKPLASTYVHSAVTTPATAKAIDPNGWARCTLSARRRIRAQIPLLKQEVREILEAVRYLRAHYVSLPPRWHSELAQARNELHAARAAADELLSMVAELELPGVLDEPQRVVVDHGREAVRP